MIEISYVWDRIAPKNNKYSLKNWQIKIGMGVSL